MRAEFFPLIAVALFLACSSPENQSSTDVTAPVSVEDVKLKPIEEFITATGTVNATKVYDLNSETEGYYRMGVNPRTSRPYMIGDQVKKGEIIVYLDNPEQENTIKIDSQKLYLDITKREFEKQQSLYDKGGVTLMELKTAERSYIEAKYAYDNAIIQLSQMKIAAPFNGVIVDLTYYTPGVKVASGKSIATVMDYSILNMEISLPSKELGRIQKNQSAKVSNYTMAEISLTGKLTQVSPALDSETRTFKAVMDIDNPDLILKPGMFVKADIIVASKDSAVVISKDIILTSGQEKRIFVVDKGTAVERLIKTGLENPTIVEVTEGLNVGDRLVTKGYETLRDRAKVKITQ